MRSPGFIMGFYSCVLRSGRSGTSCVPCQVIYWYHSPQTHYFGNRLLFCCIFSWKKKTFDMSPLVDLKKEAISAAKFFKDLKFVNIERQANMTAHEIAKFSFDSRSNGVLCNTVPPCVANCVMNNCMTRVI